MGPTCNALNPITGKPCKLTVAHWQASPGEAQAGNPWHFSGPLLNGKPHDYWLVF